MTVRFDPDNLRLRREYVAARLYVVAWLANCSAGPQCKGRIPALLARRNSRPLMGATKRLRRLQEPLMEVPAPDSLSCPQMPGIEPGT